MRETFRVNGNLTCNQLVIAKSAISAFARCLSLKDWDSIWSDANLLTFYTGTKRILYRNAAPLPIKKAIPLPGAYIAKLIATFIWPYTDRIKQVDPVTFRSIFTLFLMYSLMARYSDLQKITGQHLDVQKDHAGGRIIVVSFPLAKNHRHKERLQGVISGRKDLPYDPIRFVLLYLYRFNMRPNLKNLPGTPQPLIHRLQDHANINTPSYKPSPKPLSREQSLTDIRKLLPVVGFDGHFTHISCKAGAVSFALATGIPIEDVTLAGRWWGADTAKHYQRKFVHSRAETSKRFLPGAPLLSYRHITGPRR